MTVIFDDPRLVHRRPDLLQPRRTGGEQQGQEDEPFKVSQRKRKLDEEVFGWCKVVGGLRRMRVNGRRKIQQLADIALATLNMIRMRKLLAT